ncbi:expressed unknown protein [Seminavis robusta]|uniref:Uncharacterized protein n=1 Tax=Seminavis robusta TaxID=568900 RepID=A0A9N8HTU6_9STRA|nr:expressed unknown protein [Seminavis robusta]|eukprot:Sro1554_g282030.1 n/a (257) ;mRNA; f:11225-11995
MLLLETDSSVTSLHRSGAMITSGGDNGKGHDDERVLNKPEPVRGVIRRTSSSSRLRSNLLRKLGIPSTPTYPQQPRRGSLLRHAKVEKIPLSGGEFLVEEEARDDSPQSTREACHTTKVLNAMGALWSLQPLEQESDTTSTASSSEQHHHHVHFDPQVSVIPIPTRHDYSNRIRGFLWDTPAQMQTNILRNTLEFSADGWDWNRVLEEDAHYFNPTTCQYIHPIHLEIAKMPFEEQQVLGVSDRYVNPALATSESS